MHTICYQYNEGYHDNDQTQNELPKLKLNQSKLDSNVGTACFQTSN